jgi:hypothetical protein
MQKQRDCMHVAHFLFGLSPIFYSVRTQILGNKKLSSLGEVFGQLRQASISESNSTTLPSIENLPLLLTLEVETFLKVVVEAVVRGS